MEQKLRIEERTELLRETLANEEAVFAAFRKNQLDSLQEEIAIKESKRKELDLEVRRLSAEHAVLTQPVEVLWEKISHLGPEADLKIRGAIEREKILAEKADVLDQRDKELSQKLKTADYIEQKATETKKKADHILSRAKIEAEKIRTESNALFSQAKLKGIELETIALSLSDKQVELTEREQIISEKETKLIQREDSLKASWDILQKTAAQITNT